ncbi:MAG: ATP-grasp domain-containing protein [Campylobacterales bacterium]|nr:ATP-grasp domain-containing protein [Campylobacterales bacterium]
MIELKIKYVYYGANIYAKTPIVLATMKTDLEYQNKAIEAIQKLKLLFPNWFETLNLDRIDDNKELYIGKFIAHFSLAILNHTRGFLHSSGAMTQATNTLLWVGFHYDKLSMESLKLVLQTIQKTIETPDITKEEIQINLHSFWQLCRQYHPDFQARILMEYASKNNIPILPFIPYSKQWQFGWGSKSKVFFESMPVETSFIGATISKSKQKSKELFRRLGIPTPQYVVIDSQTKLKMASEKVGFPCVVKPLDQGKGRGVVANITNQRELNKAFSIAKKFTKGNIMVESFVEGEDHRITVIDNQFVSTTKRVPPYVVGDGKKTIKELIETINAKRLYSNQMLFLDPILMDDALIDYLAKQNLSLNTIPKDSQKIQVRSNANLSTGGTAVDFSQQTHTSIKKFAQMIAQVSGVKTLGIDYVTTDISKSYQETQGSFIEMNFVPAIDVPLLAGSDFDKILKLLLGDGVGKIESSLIVINEEEITTLEALLKQNEIEHQIGWIAKSRVYIGNILLSNSFEDNDWEKVNLLLRNKSINAIHIITTSVEIKQKGLPLERFDTLYSTQIDIDLKWSELLKESSNTFYNCETIDELYNKLHQ